MIREVHKNCGGEIVYRINGTGRIAHCTRCGASRECDPYTLTLIEIDLTPPQAGKDSTDASQ